MAEGPQFQAVIAALDKFTPTMEELARRIEVTGGMLERLPRINAEATRGLAELQRQMGAVHVDAPRVFSRFSEAAGGATEAVRVLHGHVRGLWGSLTGMVPLLAGLGSMGAVGGMFEMVAHAAESREQFAATAKALGMTTRALGQYNFMAKMAGQSTEDIQASFAKLAVNLGKAAQGEDKHLASLLSAAHIKYQDKQGRPLPLDDVLPQLHTFFLRNAENKKLPAAAETLFGKGWLPAAKMLQLPREEWKDYVDFADRLHVDATPDQDAALKAYAPDWKKMDATISSIGKSISYSLAPALEPLLRGADDFLLKHRDQLAAWVGKEARGVGTALQQITPEQWATGFARAGQLFDTISHAIASIPGALTSIAESLNAFRTSRLGRLLGIAPPAAPAAPPGAPAAEPNFFADPSGWFKYHRALTQHVLGDGPMPAYAPPPGAAPADPGRSLILKRPILSNWAAGAASLSWSDAAAPLSDYLNGRQPLGGPDAARAPRFGPMSDWAIRPLPAGAMPEWAGPYGAAPPVGAPDLATLLNLPRPLAPAPADTPTRVDGTVEMTLNIAGAPPGSTFTSRSTGAAGAVRVNLGQAFDGLYGNH